MFRFRISTNCARGFGLWALAAAISALFLSVPVGAQSAPVSAQADLSTACSRNDAEGCYRYALVLQREYHGARSREDQSYAQQQREYARRREQARQREQREIRERRQRMQQYQRQGGITGALIGGALELSNMPGPVDVGPPPTYSSAASRAAYARMQGTAIKSCELGSGAGCHFSAGLVASDDAERSFGFYRRSCKLGFAAGCKSSGDIAYDRLKEGDGGATELVALREGCDQKAGLSCWNLGYFYSIGTKLVGQDMQQAINYWEQACGLGYGGPCSAAARRKWAGSYTQEILDLYLRACLAPMRPVDASCGTAYNVLAGTTTSENLANPELASQLASDMCDGGKTVFCGYLARDYRLGRGGRQVDELQAVALMETSCEGGSRSACIELADLMVAASSLNTSPEMRKTLIAENCAEPEAAGQCGSAANSSFRRQYISRETRDMAMEVSCRNGGGVACYFRSQDALRSKDYATAFDLMEQSCEAPKSSLLACSRLIDYLAGDSQLGEKYADWPRRSSMLQEKCSSDPEKNRPECVKIAVDRVTGRYGVAVDQARGLATLRSSCKPDEPIYVYPCMWLSNFIYDDKIGGGSDPEGALALIDQFCATPASAQRCSSVYSGMARQKREYISRPWHLALNLKLCNQNALWGCLHAANAYKNGDGVEADIDMAISLSERGQQLAPDDERITRVIEGWKAQRDGTAVADPAKN